MGSSYSLSAVVKFQLEGYKNFGKDGYIKHSKSWDKKDLEVDLSGRVVIITGANSGIGFDTANELAKRNATVWMLCRNKERGQQALEEIKKNTNNSNLMLEVIDVARPSQVKNFASNFLKSGSRLDALINNAGIMLDKKQMTEDNLEMIFATNTLSGFLLTEYLLPALEKTKDSRVIMVSSGGQYTVKMEVDDFQFEKRAYSGLLSYSYTKRQQRYLCEYWAKKFSDKSIFFWSMHPGWTRTPGTKSSLPKWFDKMTIRDLGEGSDTIVWLSASEAAKKQIPNGSFVFDRQVVPGDFASGTMNSQEDIEKLYQYCSKFKEQI